MNRSRMRRQLYSGGGITSVPRVGFGVGSSIKKRLRKLIPNEIADVAVKAAPFVAPFYPGAAALMRGIGRFDKRGSISDALKQGIGTYGLGRGIGYLGGAQSPDSFLGGQTYSMEGFREGPVGRLFSGGETQQERILSTPDYKVANVTGQDPSGLGYGEFLGTAPTSGDPYSLKGIWDKWTGLNPQLRTAIVGVGSGAIAGFAQWVENQIPQEPGETTKEYMARRSAVVGDLMLQYLDNTRAFDAEWTAKTLEQKKEEIANLNYNQGGRVGYQTGGISMGNTLAQNIAANQAQAARVNQMLQAARAKLPGAAASGLTSLTQSFQPQTRSQARAQLFGGPPSGGTTTTTSKPVLQTGTQTPGGPPPVATAPMQDPMLTKYGVKQTDYDQMTPDEQDRLWRKVDYADQYGGELGTTAKILEERGIDPSKYRTTSSYGYPEYDRLGIMEAKLRSDIDELYGDWQGHGKTITGQETFDELLGLEDYWKQFRYNQGGRVGYQTGGITMANTLAENIRRNVANQAAVSPQFQKARSRLPGYVAPQTGGAGIGGYTPPGFIDPNTGKLKELGYAQGPPQPYSPDLAPGTNLWEHFNEQNDKGLYTNIPGGDIFSGGMYTDQRKRMPGERERERSAAWNKKLGEISEWGGSSREDNPYSKYGITEGSTIGDVSSYNPAPLPGNNMFTPLGGTPLPDTGGTQPADVTNQIIQQAQAKLPGAAQAPAGINSLTQDGGISPGLDVLGSGQKNSILPRLGELGSGVSSAEQELQDLNQRLGSAQTTLGHSGNGPSMPGGPIKSLEDITPGIAPGLDSYTPPEGGTGGYTGLTPAPNRPGGEAGKLWDISHNPSLGATTNAPDWSTAHGGAFKGLDMTGFEPTVTPQQDVMNFSIGGNKVQGMNSAYAGSVRDFLNSTGQGDAFSASGFTPLGGTPLPEGGLGGLGGAMSQASFMDPNTGQEASLRPGQTSPGDPLPGTGGPGIAYKNKPEGWRQLQSAGGNDNDWFDPRFRKQQLQSAGGLGGLGGARRVLPASVTGGGVSSPVQRALGFAYGGRVGLYAGGNGTPEAGIKSLDAGAPDITYEGERPAKKQEMKMAGPDWYLKRIENLMYNFNMSYEEAGEIAYDSDKYFEVIGHDPYAKGPVLPSPEDPINPWTPKPQGPVLPNKMMAAQGGRIGYAGGKTARTEWETVKRDLNNIFQEAGGLEGNGMNAVGAYVRDNNLNYEWLLQGDEIKVKEKENMDEPVNILDNIDGSNIININGIKLLMPTKKAQGGRIGYRFGPGPVAQAGIPGIPRMAPDGMEYDMSENGGFQPLGAREGKDDVKANLAKNEFVFTADAVRGAGNGDIELGAQKMYDTMKKLERRVG